MCGIVCAIGNISIKHEKALQQMLIFDSVRGIDSTGLLGVKKHDEEHILAKQMGNPFELFDTSKYKAIMGTTTRVLIGHNRWATQGKVNKYNSHPFEFETLIGVHNGSLTNKHALHEGHKYDVDSQALYGHIEANGVDDALKTARGAFALVWWDKINNNINFIRNEERPLHWALSTDPNARVLFLASEAWMIEVACARNEIAIGEVASIDVGFLHQIHVPKGGNMEKPVIRKVEFAPKITNVYELVGQNSFRGQQQQTVKEETVNSSSVLDTTFLRRRAVTFESVVERKDKHGAKYIAAFATDRPNLECRLYWHRDADRIFNAIGCEFEGDIGGFVNLTGKTGYYKISPSSVRITDFAKIQEKEETLYPDHNNKGITEEEWKKQYSCCGFCNGNVLPIDLEFGARFTKDGDIVCNQCTSDVELSKYMNFI